MNILFIGHERDLNGASKSMIELINSLKEKHHFFVLTAYEDGKFRDKLKELKVETVILPYFRWCDRRNNIIRWYFYLTRWYLWGNRINQRTANAMVKFVEDKNIDIIHTNSSVIDIGLRIKKMTNIHHIMHIREFGDLDFRMYPLIPRNIFFRRMNELSDLYICNSKAVAQHYYLLKNTKKKVIYNGVSPSYNIEKEYTIKQNVNLLISGRICKEKGQHIAVEAIEHLVDRGIANIRLYIAGRGRIRIPRHIASYVKVLGEIDDMKALRKKMDVELVCSYAEAFGRVTVEAMLGGLAVIGSDAGGTSELICDGVNGLLFKRGDSIDLADKIQYLIENKDQIERIGRTGHEYAYKNFLTERCATEINCEYSKMLKH